MTNEEVIAAIALIPLEALAEVSRNAELITAAKERGEWPTPAASPATRPGIVADARPPDISRGESPPQPDSAPPKFLPPATKLALACREFTRDYQCGCSGRRCTRSGEIVAWNECLACKSAELPRT
ncbi:hypothetical protein EP7_005640 (plasmid) [Isosphaeraceae bacterium EP7]